MKRLHSHYPGIIVLIILSVAGCSLSSDITKMEGPEDFDAYIRKWAPNEDAFLAVQKTAEPYITRRSWDSAVAVYEKYRSYFPQMEKRFNVIIDDLQLNTPELEVENLGAGINTEYDEIKPTISINGKRIFFASDRPGGVGKQDIYVAVLGEDGKWQPAQNIGDKINTPEHETINGLSFDGTSILLFGKFNPHLGRGDNYYYEKTEQGWSTVKNFPYPVNSKFYDSDGFLTADGNAFIFTSDREGNIGKFVPKETRFHGSDGGNTDIWVCTRQGKGRWSQPVNLGSVINTPYSERTAFLHPDGKTLYFSSDGHPGFGGLDVYKSVRLKENSWTEWSTPINLGKQINTAQNDWGYKVSTDGRYAYYSATSGKNSFGENDIYRIKLPSSARPEGPVALREGRITDSDGNPLAADIVVQDLNTGDTLATLKTDPQTGAFSYALPDDSTKKVGLFATREGYYPSSLSDDLLKGNNGKNGKDGQNGNNNGDDGTDGKNGKNGNNGNDGKNGNNGNNGDDLNRLNEGDYGTIVLNSIDDLLKLRDQWGDRLAQRVNNIFFDFGKWDLRQESYLELDRLYAFLESNPAIRIQVGAHTDDVGSDEFNMDLSQKRAKSVVDYLITKGIVADRLVAKGFGETRPEVPNDSDENRQLNRRVEFRIAE